MHPTPRAAVAAPLLRDAVRAHRRAVSVEWCYYGALDAPIADWHVALETDPDFGRRLVLRRTWRGNPGNHVDTALLLYDHLEVRELLHALTIVAEQVGLEQKAEHWQEVRP